MGEFICGILARIVLGLILLPVLLVISTPLILVAALFGKGRYRANVRAGYGGVGQLWGDICSQF